MCFWPGCTPSCAVQRSPYFITISKPDLEIGGLRISPASHTVHLHQTVLQLTPKEFYLLYALALKADQVISINDLLLQIWGGEFEGQPQVLYMHLRALRKKNVLTMKQAYRVIEWRIIFLVAGILPLGMAMNKTGATALFANALTSIVGPFGPQALLLGLLLLTVLLSQVMKGAAVSAVIAPIAIQAAEQIGIDPRSMAMGVELATSMAFVTPLGHPVNILMLGPGGYRFRDFLKVGLPLTILLFIIVLVVLPIFWPFTVR